MPEFAVGDIQPNPFRHIDRYPIKREKVDQLRESYRTTGFWENIPARLVNGKPQIPFGHHRKQALEEEFGPKHKITIAIRDFSDEMMLQMMARENMEEWGTTAMVEHETVRAVVEAYAEGKISLAGPTSGGTVRYAPSFVIGEKVPGAAEPRPYTVQAIGQFLGWMTPNGRVQDKVGDALGALEMIELELLTESDFEGLTGEQASMVITEARRVRKQHEDAARHAEREAKEAERMRAQAEQARAAAEAREAEARDQREREEARRQAEQARKDEQQLRRRRETQTKAATEQRSRASERTTHVGRSVSSAMKSGVGTRHARITAIKAQDEMRRESRPQTLPNADAFIRRLSGDLHKVLHPDHDPKVDRLNEIIKYRDVVPAHERDDLIATLESLGRRINDYVVQLKSKPARSTAPSVPELPAARR